MSIHAELWSAIKANDISRVKTLLAAGADPGYQRNQGLTAVHLACAFNHPQVLDLLLDAGGSPNATDDEKQTPLQIAAVKGHLDIIERLLKRGVDVEQRGNYGTALDRATFEGHVHVMAALLNSGAFVNAKNAWGRTALHEAASEGHVEAARLLLRRGAEVDAVDWRGNDRTPLHEAMCPGDGALVKLLLLYGANLEHRNSWGATPLHMAARTGAADVVEVLLNAGADRNLTDQQGRIPLDEAREQHHVTIISMLGTQHTRSTLAPPSISSIKRQRKGPSNLDRYKEAMRVLKAKIKSSGYMSAEELEFRSKVLTEALKDLGFRYQPDAQQRLARNQEARRALTAPPEPGFKSAKEITSEVKPLMLKHLLQLDRIKRHQELAHEVTWLSPAHQPLLVIFVSHRWEDATHPDPFGTQLRILKAFAQLFIDMAVGFKRQRHKRLKQIPTLKTHGALQTAYFVGAIADFMDSFDGAESMLRYILLTRVGIFYDHMCLPQNPRTEDEETEFLEGMRKFRRLIASTPILVLRCPDDEYSFRSWCEVEFWSGAKLSGHPFPTTPVLRLDLWGQDIDVLKLAPPSNLNNYSSFLRVLKAVAAWEHDDYVTAKDVAEVIMHNYDNAFSLKEKACATPLITRPCFRAHNESSMRASPPSFQFWNSIREKLCIDGLDNEDFAEVLQSHMNAHGISATEDRDRIATALWLLSCHELSFDSGFIIFYGRCLLRYLFEGKDLKVTLFFRLPTQQVHFRFADGEESLEG